MRHRRAELPENSLWRHFFETYLQSSGRSVTITNPMGYRSKWETDYITGIGGYLGTSPYTTAENNLSETLTAQENVNPEVAVATNGYRDRITYHWSEKQMHFHEGDYSKATQYFWLQSQVAPTSARKSFEAVRKPFVNMTFFKYPNQT